MNNTDLEIVIGALLPILVAFIKRAHFANTVNSLIAIVVYVIAGLIAVFATGQAIDLNNIIPTVAIFVTAGTVAYTLFWKNWGDPQIQAALSGPPASG